MSTHISLYRRANRIGSQSGTSYYWITARNYNEIIPEGMVLLGTIHGPVFKADEYIGDETGFVGAGWNLLPHVREHIENAMLLAGFREDEHNKQQPDLGESNPAAYLEPSAIAVDQYNTFVFAFSEEQAKKVVQELTKQTA